MHSKIRDAAREAAMAGLRMKRMEENWFIECRCGWSTKISTPSEHPDAEAEKINKIFREHRAHL